MPQARKIETARALPAPTVVVGEVGGQPAITTGTKGAPSLKVLEPPGGEPIAPKGEEAKKALATEVEKKDIQALGNARDIITQLKDQWDSVAPESRGESSLLYTQARMRISP